MSRQQRQVPASASSQDLYSLPVHGTSYPPPPQPPAMSHQDIVIPRRGSSSNLSGLVTAPLPIPASSSSKTDRNYRPRARDHPLEQWQSLPSQRHSPRHINNPSEGPARPHPTFAHSDITRASPSSPPPPPLQSSPTSPVSPSAPFAHTHSRSGSVASCSNMSTHSNDPLHQTMAPSPLAHSSSTPSVLSSSSRKKNISKQASEQTLYTRPQKPSAARTKATAAAAASQQPYQSRLDPGTSTATGSSSSSFKSSPLDLPEHRGRELVDAPFRPQGQVRNPSHSGQDDSTTLQGSFRRMTPTPTPTLTTKRRTGKDDTASIHSTTSSGSGSGRRKKRNSILLAGQDGSGGAPPKKKKLLYRIQRSLARDKQNFKITGTGRLAQFSNERLYLHWIRFGVLQGSIAVMLLSFGIGIASYIGVGALVLALATLVYATTLYHVRHLYMITKREDVVYFARWMPTLLTVGLIILYGANFVVTLTIGADARSPPPWTRGDDYNFDSYFPTS